MTTTQEYSGPLHRLPVRDPQPPLDDDPTSAIGPAPDRPAHGGPVQGALALAFSLTSGLPAVPAPAPDTGGRHLRLVAADDPIRRPGRGARTQRGRQRDQTDDDFGPRPTPRAFLPPPRPWAARLVQAIVEVAMGARPAGQLVRWTTSEVYDAIRHRVSLVASTPPAGRAPRAAHVRSVHLSEPADGVAEVCALVQHGSRCRVIALRLEGFDGRWQCTALQFG